MKTLPNTLFILAVFLATSCQIQQADKTVKIVETLDSWQSNCDEASFCIDTFIDFVQKATTPGADYVESRDRIAVFDMDGTIACERPISMQLYVTSLWGLDSTINCDVNEHQLQDEVITKIGGYVPTSITTDSILSMSTSYSKIINNNCIPENNPQTRTLCQLFYQPMLEVIQYLIDHEFKVYIVSGSSQAFIRGIVKNIPVLQNLPPSQIIGSLQEYETITHVDGAGPVFYNSESTFLANVSSGKAINIYNRIGQIPLIAFGNTVDDFDMFSITSTNPHKSLCVLINHDSGDWEAEYTAYKTTKKVTDNWNNPAITSNWNQSIFDSIMTAHNWHLANMSECFVKDSLFVN